MTQNDFRSLLYATLGIEDVDLDMDIALREQILVSSLRIVELAILLEQDLGADIEDDINLAALSPAELHSLINSEAK